MPGRATPPSIAGRAPLLRRGSSSGCRRRRYREEAAALCASGQVLAAGSAAPARLLAGTGLLSRRQIPHMGAAAQEPAGHAPAGPRSARAESSFCGDAQAPQSQQCPRKAVQFLMGLLPLGKEEKLQLLAPGRTVLSLTFEHAQYIQYSSSGKNTPYAVLS